MEIGFELPYYHHQPLERVASLCGTLGKWSTQVVEKRLHAGSLPSWDLSHHLRAPEAQSMDAFAQQPLFSPSNPFLLPLPTPPSLLSTHSHQNQEILLKEGRCLELTFSFLFGPKFNTRFKVKFYKSWIFVLFAKHVPFVMDKLEPTSGIWGIKLFRYQG